MFFQGQLIFFFSMLIVSHLITDSLASEILVLLPVLSRSHLSLISPILKTLAASGGHRITELSYRNETNSDTTNYEQIYLARSGDEIISFIDKLTIEHTREYRGFMNYFKLMTISDMEHEWCTTILTHEHVKKILRKEAPTPDLIIGETFHVPCVLSIAEKLDVPFIDYIPAPDGPGTNYLIGNPMHPAYSPLFINGYTEPMNFYQRMVNTIQYFVLYIVHYSFSVYELLRFDSTYVVNSDVNIDKLYRRCSLALYNTHFILRNKPMPPNAIEIGGVHIKDTEPLPADIKEFIEQAEDGVIFFSFGSTIKSDSMGTEKIDMFKKAFSQIRQRIIWRCSAPDLLKNVSANVMIRKWLPQKDILDHENVKAFISHGGMLSSFEAIHTATPVIGIPFMWDQFSNINILQKKGAAIYLDFGSLNHDTLLNALIKIINDNRYQTNMQKLSKIFKDRPVPLLDNVVYWIEYVIKYKGASYLRIAAADMPLYKFLLLDVASFIIFIFTIVLLAVYCIVKKY